MWINEDMNRFIIVLITGGSRLTVILIIKAFEWVGFKDPQMVSSVSGAL